MRDAFIKSLIKIASVNKKLVLLTGDLGFTVFEDFIKKFPDRFFNMGVAEANMMGVACGLAQSGLIPVVYSIATFASMRPYEQIRTDICLHNSNVKIIGSGSGLSYGHAGSTHHSLEDISLMRVMPNMTVVCASDANQISVALPEIINYEGPVYLRLGKKGEPDIYKELPFFKIGKANHLKEGKHLTIIATGAIVYNALQAAEILEKKGIFASVIDMHTLKPLDKDILSESVVNSKFIYTVEEHFISGGLGSSVAEIVSGFDKQVYLYRIGINNKFMEKVGSQQYLRDLNCLSPVKIARDVGMHFRKYA